MKRLHTDDFAAWAKTVTAGEEILLSGTVYTARDAAHKRMFAALAAGEPLPFEIKNAFIYYAGPTPKTTGAVGACGPTTSSRMDVYAPRLYQLGLACTIGKGDRSPAVYDAIRQTGGLYLCAIGGAGALASRAIQSAEVIAYDDLGCESVKRFIVSDFPLFVAIDTNGAGIFYQKVGERA